MLTAIKPSVIQFDTERTIFYLDSLWVMTVMSEFPQSSRLLPPSRWFQEMCSDCRHLASCKTFGKWIWGRWVQSFSSQTAMVKSKVQIPGASSINTGDLPEDGTLNVVVLPLLRCLVPHHQEMRSPCSIQCWDPSVPLVTLIVAWPHYLQSFSSSLSRSFPESTSISGKFCVRM